MFKPVEIITRDPKIQKAWRGLQRKVQTVIEHMRVFNGSGAPLVRGHVVALDGTGDRVVDLADANGVQLLTNKLAVVCEPVATGGSGIARYQGLTYVKFVNGLGGTLVEGTPAFLSNTPGEVTNVDPGTDPYLGIIADATGYVTVTNPFAWVIMNRCCRAAENGPG